jgi:hypothetical protein
MKFVVIWFVFAITAAPVRVLKCWLLWVWWTFKIYSLGPINWDAAAPISRHVIMHHGHCWSVTFTGSVLNGRFPTPYVRVTVPTAGYCPKYPVFTFGRAETFSLFIREFESTADWGPLPRLFWMKIWHLALWLLHSLVEVIKCLPILFCDNWFGLM